MVYSGYLFDRVAPIGQLAIKNPAPIGQLAIKNPIGQFAVMLILDLICTPLPKPVFFPEPVLQFLIGRLARVVTLLVSVGTISCEGGGIR